MNKQRLVIWIFVKILTARSVATVFIEMNLLYSLKSTVLQTRNIAAGLKIIANSKIHMSNSFEYTYIGYVCLFLEEVSVKVLSVWTLEEGGGSNRNYV